MKCFVSLIENERHPIGEDLKRSGGLMFAHIDDMHTRRVPSASISPRAFSSKRCLLTTRAHDPPRRGHRVLGIHAVIDSPYNIVHLARADFCFRILQRHSATETALQI